MSMVGNGDDSAVAILIVRVDKVSIGGKVRCKKSVQRQVSKLIAQNVFKYFHLFRTSWVQTEWDLSCCVLTRRDDFHDFQVDSSEFCVVIFVQICNISSHFSELE